LFTSTLKQPLIFHPRPAPSTASYWWRKPSCLSARWSIGPSISLFPLSLSLSLSLSRALHSAV